MVRKKQNLVVKLKAANLKVLHATFLIKGSSQTETSVLFMTSIYQSTIFYRNI